MEAGVEVPDLSSATGTAGFGEDDVDVDTDVRAQQRSAINKHIGFTY